MSTPTTRGKAFSFLGRKKHQDSSTAHIPGMREILKHAGTTCTIDCTERVKLAFPSSGAFLDLLDSEELYEFLRRENLVLVQDSNISVYLELKSDWEHRMNHDWHLILDQRALDATDLFLADHHEEIRRSLGNHLADLDLARGRVHLKLLSDISISVEKINRILQAHWYPLEAIALSRVIMFEYRERKKFDDSYYAI